VFLFHYAGFSAKGLEFISVGVEWERHSSGGVPASDTRHLLARAIPRAGHVPCSTERGVR